MWKSRKNNTLQPRVVNSWFCMSSFRLVWDDFAVASCELVLRFLISAIFLQYTSCVSLSICLFSSMVVVTSSCLISFSFFEKSTNFFVEFLKDRMQIILMNKFTHRFGIVLILILGFITFWNFILPDLFLMPLRSVPILKTGHPRRKVFVVSLSPAWRIFFHQ